MPGKSQDILLDDEGSGLLGLGNDGAKEFGRGAGEESLTQNLFRQTARQWFALVMNLNLVGYLSFQLVKRRARNQGLLHTRNQATRNGFIDGAVDDRITPRRTRSQIFTGDTVPVGVRNKLIYLLGTRSPGQQLQGLSYFGQIARPMFVCERIQ